MQAHSLLTNLKRKNRNLKYGKKEKERKKSSDRSCDSRAQNPPLTLVIPRIKSELLPLPHKALLRCALPTASSSASVTSLVHTQVPATSCFFLFLEHANLLCDLAGCSFCLEGAFLALCVLAFSSSFPSQPRCCLFGHLFPDFPI